MTDDDPIDPSRDITTAQDVVDSAAKRKSPEWVHENIQQVLEPLKIMGIDPTPADIELPEQRDKHD